MPQHRAKLCFYFWIVFAAVGGSPAHAQDDVCKPGQARHELGAGYHLRVERLCESEDAARVTMTVTDAKDGVVQTIDLGDQSPPPGLEIRPMQLTGGALADLYVPDMAGNANTSFSLWAFNPQKQAYESVLETGALSLERTKEGLVLTEARSSCCAYTSDLYRWDAARVRLVHIVSVEVVLGGPRDGKPGAKAACKAGYGPDPVTKAKRPPLALVRRLCAKDAGRSYRFTMTPWPAGAPAP